LRGLVDTKVVEEEVLSSMKPLALSLVIFVMVLGGIFLGMLLRRALPQSHLSKDTQDAVRLGVGLVATIAGLVLGLLIGAAKSSFDTKSGQVAQITADIILVDALLAQYGSEARPIRQQIRTAIGPFVERIWHDEAAKGAPFATNADAEQVYLEIQAMAPSDNLQRALQARLAQISTDVTQLRLLLFVETNNPIPAPFLVVLVAWLIIIFASFSLFSDMNATVFIALCTFALSAAAAIYLILELNDPFTGLMRIPSRPLLGALGPLNP
jgi:hypothetical protein